MTPDPNAMWHVVHCRGCDCSLYATESTSPPPVSYCNECQLRIIRTRLHGDRQARLEQLFDYLIRGDFEDLDYGRGVQGKLQELHLIL
jgi:hypothetical protein